MLLRTLLLLLLAANAGFYAWRAGWLEPVSAAIGLPGPTQGREPQRLAQQVRPDAIKLLPARPAAAAESAAAPVPASAASGPADTTVTACLEAGPFRADERTLVENALREVQPALRWEWRDAAPGWWLAMGPFPDRESVTRKREELQRRGITPEAVNSGGAVLLVLGRYAQRTEADAQLLAMTARGVQSARVLAPPTGSQPTQQLLRVPAADAAQQERLAALTREQTPASRFAPCPAPNGTGSL